MAIYNVLGERHYNGSGEHFVTMASHSDSVGGHRLGCQPSTLDGSWLPIVPVPSFPTNRVDIFRVRLDVPEGTANDCGVLSPEEVARANRFHFEKDRVHFSRCRAALRHVLASYFAMPASEIRIQYLANGKPQLAAEHNPHALRFSVSHAAGVALIAVGSAAKLGVDIEKIRSDVNTEALAERFFSLQERAGLRALPNHLRVAGFYACWTRKEAFLKATGEGLSFPLADFSVSTNPGGPPLLEDIRGDKGASEQWFLADIEVGPGYRAAVALDGHASHLATYAWN